MPQQDDLATLQPVASRTHAPGFRITNLISRCEQRTKSAEGSLASRMRVNRCLMPCEAGTTTRDGPAAAI